MVIEVLTKTSPSSTVKIRMDSARSRRSAIRSLNVWTAMPRRGSISSGTSSSDAVAKPALRDLAKPSGPLAAIPELPWELSSEQVAST